MGALAVPIMKVVGTAVVGSKVKGKSGSGMTAPGGPGGTGTPSLGSSAATAAVTAATTAAVNRATERDPKLPPEKPVAPIPDEEEVRRSTRRRAALRFGRLGSGRASTILDTSNTLGGG